MRTVHISETKYLLLDVSTTNLRPSIWHMRSVHISETKYLLLDVSPTAIRPCIWHMRQVHISETKYLLLDVSITTLRPSIWHMRYSTHQWDQVSTRCQYYYLEAQYMTHEMSVHTNLSPVFDTCGQMSVHIQRPRIWPSITSVRLSRCQYYYHWGPVYDTWGQYTSVRPSIYC